MSWTDDEIDKVFREAAEHPVFEYQASYFQDIEKQLPIKKGRKIGWYWWTANVFIVGFISLVFLGNWSAKNDGKIATVETPKVEKDILVAQTTVLKSQRTRSTGFTTTSSVNSIDRIGQSTKNQQIGKNSTPKKEVVETKLPSSIRLQDVLHREVLKTENLDSEIETLSLTENYASLDASLLLLELEPFGFENQQLANNLYPLKKIKNSFYIGMNAGVEQAWTSNKLESSSMNSRISFELGYRIPMRNFQFSAGLGIEATKLDDLRIKERTKLYGFGSSILENSYQFNSIYSLIIPVEISKSFGRHSIGFGLVGEMNVFAHASHEKTVDGIRTANATGFTNVDLFNRFNVIPSLSYSLALTDKLQLGLALQAQLIQPLNSDRFIGAPTKLPVSGQMFIKRSLKF
ncbi:MAG: hypothetical protein RI922_2004 [Bacteroidota bacterium]|jgi:hypothetical protein